MIDFYSLIWEYPIILIVCSEQHHEFSKVSDHATETAIIARHSRRLMVSVEFESSCASI